MASTMRTLGYVWVALSFCIALVSSENKTSEKLKRLRALMKDLDYVHRTLDAYVVPMEDAHQSEFVALQDKRIEFISGFTGSQGIAIITEDKAALGTDGRYLLQASRELDGNWALIPQDYDIMWLRDNLPAGSVIGIDPNLVSADSWKQMDELLKEGDQHLVAIDKNLIDILWEDRPVPSVNPIWISLFAEPLEKKLSSVRSRMSEQQAGMLILTSLDEIAWLYDLRGGDIDYNPVFFAYSVITMDSAHLFVDERKITPEVETRLSTGQPNATVSLHSYDAFLKDLEVMIKDNYSKIWITYKCSYSIYMLIPEARSYEAISPVADIKAVKSSEELEGMKLANEYDGAALCEYFAWLEREVPRGNVTELSASEKLFQLKKKRKSFIGMSFPTVSSSGPSGSIMHYIPTEETDRKLTTEEVYLCDSGGQYLEGTTDITRTLHFGSPSQNDKEHFTRVLKAHIALMTAKFPKHVSEEILDAFARRELWEGGLDYGHGTMHGIGSCLYVHEEPYPRATGFREGMVIANEPGYYEDDKFGFRVEGAMVVVEAETKNATATKFLTFEPITFVPVQRKLIEASMLTLKEISWLNHYHIKCRETVGNRLKQEGKSEAYEWLLAETQPFSPESLVMSIVARANINASINALHVYSLLLSVFGNL